MPAGIAAARMPEQQARNGRRQAIKRYGNRERDS